jgi:selenocysteine lyase/cysteine desulfurase
MAFYAIDFRPGDRILTASAEYGSNFIAYLQVAERTGATVEVVPDDESGQLSVTELERLLDDKVKLVSVTHVPTNGGLVNPAEAIGAVVRGSPALFLLDACQSAGQLPLDVDRVGCDLLTVTGRKFLRGPRATGFLYAREGTTAHLEPPFLDVRAASWDAPDRYTMRSDARRFETWETNRAANIGLGVAIEYALEVGIDAIADRNTRLARRLRELLAAIPGVQVLDLGPAPCAIVSLLVSGLPAAVVKEALAQQTINVSISVVQDTRIDMERRGLDEWIRASVHYFNTEEELQALADVVGRLSASS